MRKKLLEIRDLSVRYHAADGLVRAVNNVSLTLEEGETLGLVGETGAGKTTTALSLLRLLPKRTSEVHSEGIFLDGVNLLELPEKEMCSIRVIELHWNMSRQETAAKVDEIMESVGLPAERKEEYPHQFSGGMKQRIVIAIALACNPELLIADEPTTALDVTIQAQILHMIEELKREKNTSMILITHDLGIVVEMCSKVAIMYAGEIVESGSVEDIYGDRRHPYTIGLVNSVPNLEDEQTRLTPVNGLMPDPADLPPGCKFHPRCPHASDRCRSEQPHNTEVSPGHLVQCHLAAECGKEE